MSLLGKSGATGARRLLSFAERRKRNQSAGALDGLPTPSDEVETALVYQRQQQENVDQELGCLRLCQVGLTDSWIPTLDFSCNLRRGPKWRQRQQEHQEESRREGTKIPTVTEKALPGKECTPKAELLPWEERNQQEAQGGRQQVRESEREQEDDETRQHEGGETREQTPKKDQEQEPDENHGEKHTNKLGQEKEHGEQNREQGHGRKQEDDRPPERSAAVMESGAKDVSSGECHFPRAVEELGTACTEVTSPSQVRRTMRAKSEGLLGEQRRRASANPRNRSSGSSVSRHSWPHKPSSRRSKKKSHTNVVSGFGENPDKAMCYSKFG